jgi:hypothetical protein
MALHNSLRAYIVKTHTNDARARQGIFYSCARVRAGEWKYALRALGAAGSSDVALTGHCIIYARARIAPWFGQWNYSLRAHGAAASIHGLRWPLL